MQQVEQHIRPQVGNTAVDLQDMKVLDKLVPEVPHSGRNSLQSGLGTHGLALLVRMKPLLHCIQQSSLRN
jgi:hypothetical protein